MTIAQGLLSEFEFEMAATRATLKRVPDSLFGWRPHAKSGTTGWLVSHLASMVDWLPLILSTPELDLNPPGGPSYESPEYATTAAALAAFDAHVTKAKAALAAASDETMLESWSLKGGGEVYFTLPRAGVVRSMVISHLIHHRAQLGLYLRLNDVPLPATYGPSADEGS